LKAMPMPSENCDIGWLLANGREHVPLHHNFPDDLRRAVTPGGRQMANTWQGAFPRENLKLDGYERTSPVTAFPPNGYGVYDMIGNVWEWTSDWYSPKYEADADKACCIPINPGRS
jgi:formylglycine-generating enzyme required for sulfatase activity